MDVRQAGGAAGLAAAALVAWLVGLHLAAVAAGVVGALAAATADRGARGLAAASLALAVAVQILAVGLADARGPAVALATIGVAVGVAAAVHALADGRTGGFVAAWAALAVLAAAALATLAAGAPSFLSLLGARLATYRGGWLALVAPLVLVAGAASLAFDRWRQADLPAVACVAGPPGAVVAVGLLAGPGVPDMDTGLVVAPPPGLTVLLWAAAAALVASAVAAGAATVDQRFRRPPTWLAAAVGPVALLAVLAVDAGVFVATLLAAVPRVEFAVGAVIGTGAKAFVEPFFGAAVAAALGLAAAAPALWPRANRAVAAHSEDLVLVGLLPAPLLALGSYVRVVYIGGVAVVAWLLVADRRTLPGPPRTEVERTAALVVAAVAGTGVAVVAYLRLSWVPANPGGFLLLAGAAVIAVAIAR